MLKSIRILFTSPVLIFWGIVLMYWSQPLFFSLGHKGRLGTLFLGFCLIVCAVMRRLYLFRGRVNYAVIAIVPVYFGVLLMLSYGQGHLSLTLQNVIFQVICWSLFVVGYFLAQTREVDTAWEDSLPQLAFSLVVLIVMYRFLDFVKVISFAGVSRGFGDSQLNPVGAAYVSMMLGLAFLYQSLFSNRIAFRPIYLVVFAFCCFAIVSTGSRGAPLWGVVTICIFAMISIRKGLVAVNSKLLLWLLLTAVLAPPIVLYVLDSNYAIAERFDILVKRFTKLFEILDGGTGGKSAAARSGTWQYYLQTIPEWFLLGERGYSKYPHNQWLEVLIRFGVLGLPLLIMSIYIFGRTLWYGLFVRCEISREWMFIGALFVFAYLQSMTSLSLDVNRALWFGAGYMLGYRYFPAHNGMRRNAMNGGRI